MSQREPTEPYVWQPGPVKTLEDKGWAVSGPGAADHDGKRYTKAEAEKIVMQLKRIRLRVALGIDEPITFRD